MAINSQDLANDLRFALDANLDVDHYDDTLDMIPSINLAVRWLVNVVNRTLNHKKLGDEIFRDLTVAEVFTLSPENRISLPTGGAELWTILAVYPNPNAPSGVHVSAKKAAKRLTIEEWASNCDNPFEAGSESDSSCAELNEYAYLSPFNYDGSGNNREIEIRPTPPNGLATVFYVRRPLPITALGTSDIEFPDSVYTLIFNKALNYISYKQGDGTSAFAVSQNDIQLLLNTIL